MDQKERKNGARPVIPDSDREAIMVDEYLQCTPRINLGALFIPPIWGPAKGIWLTILWYPLWVFADNCIYAWWSQGTALATVVGVLTLVLLVSVTFFFAIVSRPQAALHAIRKGKTKEQFQRGERLWAVAGIVLGIVLIGFATYYNLYIRVPFAS